MAAALLSLTGVKSPLLLPIRLANSTNSSVKRLPSSHICSPFMPVTLRGRHKRLNSLSCRAEIESGGNLKLSPPQLDHSLKEGLVFSTIGEEFWDSGGIGGAVVKRYESDNEERWYMWYQGWHELGPDEKVAEGSVSLPEASGGSSISEQNSDGKFVKSLPSASVGLALSSNGLHWRRIDEILDGKSDVMKGAEGMVMQPSPDWWTLDTHHCNVSDVLIMSSQRVRARAGVYWMFYAGGTREEVPLPKDLADEGLGLGLGLGAGSGLELGSKPQAGELVEGLRRRPGLAMSNDGWNWARIEGDHHSGALFDVGKEGEWDSLYIDAPQVIFHEPGDIRMYYHSFHEGVGRFTVGLARSRDGLKWVKLGQCIFTGEQKPFEALGIAARQVIPDPNENGCYLMFYEGVASDGSKSIGIAKSKTGLWEWERLEGGPVLSPSAQEGAWDCWSVGSPCVVDMGNGKWRLYYVGVGNDGKRALGMAENEGEGLLSFRRWRNTLAD